MNILQNPIIPLKQEFYNLNSNKIINWEPNINNGFDFKAIASFCSLGFMLDDDTFYNKIKVFKPGYNYELNKKFEIISKVKNWEWHYKPNQRSFKNILEEFTNIFEQVVLTGTKGKKILLPISGGLDSRTLVVPVAYRKELTLVSYEFEDGFEESKFGSQISKQFNIPFYNQKIQRGYLWHEIDNFYDLNNCYTDFTHPRQVNVINNWKGLGDVIVLGHWGDVLFDKQFTSNIISYEDQLFKLKGKILNIGSMELSQDLWKYWGLEGSFDTYITDRLNKLYKNIKIDHPDARMRAFKSLYWAPRWTSINLSIFNRVAKVILPYYSDEMCKFICSVPEEYLSERQIQIEYIKRNCPEIADVPWQKYYPCNLYNYKQFNYPQYYLIRAVRKASRIINKYMTRSEKLISRNWELQFLGSNNYEQLKINLKGNKDTSKLLPEILIEKYLYKFQVNPAKYAHSISMLLTITVFLKRHFKE